MKSFFKYLKKIILNLKPVINYSKKDKIYINNYIHTDISVDPDYFVFSYTYDNTAYFLKFKKVITEFPLFKRKEIIPINLDYQFFKGEIYGHPTFYTETSNKYKALFITKKEECYLSDDEFEAQFKPQIKQLSIRAF